MFESRLQTAQFFLAVSLLLLFIGALVFIFGAVVVAIFCLLLQAAAAGVGCYLYADVKGYPGPIGLALGVACGIGGALFILILPDQSPMNPRDRDEPRTPRRGMRRKRRDVGYEVLDDD